MTTRQARKVIKRIRKGARYPERTRYEAAQVLWRRFRRSRARVKVRAEATILVAIEERAT